MDYVKLQKEHYGWLQRMYPGQDWLLPAAGIVEEAGELLHAVLKTKQIARWGEEPWHDTTTREQVIDAVGDCVIYCCSLCNTVDFEFAPIVQAAKLLKSTKYYDGHLEQTITVVKAATVTATNCDRGSMAAFLVALMDFADASSIDFEGAVEQTWNVVQRRSR